MVNTNKIIICPLCGKPALRVHRYKSGSILTEHEVKKGLLGFTEITKSCWHDARRKTK
jgi:hypothetical protein